MKALCSASVVQFVVKTPSLREGDWYDWGVYDTEQKAQLAAKSLREDEATYGNAARPVVVVKRACNDEPLSGARAISPEDVIAAEKKGYDMEGWAAGAGVRPDAPPAEKEHNAPHEPPR